ncbi:hypothetical protein AVEN_120815-1 [Araneus ventricosus]|uniref:Uncharacterized protein n=1 Tax=Araneus ventricosus TaxID=182803 RepID=A0A4Y2FG19_ARAVE|nr:hypothetical protein AVEN_120815-1 [Araneus ventricosus]
MGPTFFLRIGATQSGIDSTSRRKSLEEIFSHSASPTVHNCESVSSAGVWARTDLSIMSHICSMGLMSGDLGGQIIRWNCPECSSNQSLTISAM